MGRLFCLLSALGFGVMAVFGKLAYDAGVSVNALLLVRFGLSGALLLAVALARGSLRRLPRRTVLTGLAMGVLGYAAQSGLYFSALTRIDASLVALILYLYPVLVMVAAIALRREQASRRRMWALGTALAGIGLVLSGAVSGHFDWTGVLLALGAPVVYTAYILVGDSLAVPPLELTALVCCGAFGTFLVVAAVHGTSFSFAPMGWLWLAAVALVSTVGAILCFFAGMARVGPSVASILSIFEPVVTVIAAAAVLGEKLTPIQWLGGAFVLSAVLIVQWPHRFVAGSFDRFGRVRRQTGSHEPVGGVGRSSRVRDDGRGRLHDGRRGAPCAGLERALPDAHHAIRLDPSVHHPLGDGPA